MSFPERGRSVDSVLRELAERTERDFHYGDGRIAGSMISAPHPLVLEVFARTLEKNVGDPGLFPGSVELEAEAVAWLASLLHGDGATGQLVTGGNEANIVSMWVARAVARKYGKRERRRVLVPESAHVSWDKAASLLDLELVRLPLDATMRCRVDAVEDALDARTLAVVAVAGCTPLGCVDPISEIAALARAADVWLHVDAAYGGMVLPFLHDLGEAPPPFDFAVEGVASITVDPHKMGLAAQPAGGLLFRCPDAMRAVEVDIPYLAGGKSAQATLTGTRSGAAALAVWALIAHLGRDGYREIVRHAMQRTRRFAERVRKSLCLELVVPPTMNILGIRPLRSDVPSFVRRLRERSWAVGEFRTHARVVFLPHLTDDRLEALFDALEDCAEA